MARPGEGYKQEKNHAYNELGRSSLFCKSNKEKQYKSKDQNIYNVPEFNIHYGIYDVSFSDRNYTQPKLQENYVLK